MRAPKNSSAAALTGIWTILLLVFIIAVLYFGRELLIPLALAALITFLLAPLVSRLERFIGRIAAVLIVVAMLFGILTAGGWLLTRQLLDLATKLPDYQTNIESKLQSFRMPTGGAFSRVAKSIEQLRKELPGAGIVTPPAPATGRDAANPRLGTAPVNAAPVPVRVVDSRSEIPQILQTTVTAVLSPLGTAGLVLLLVIFMLLKREDLRGRLIRLIGQGHISETTRAMDDAGTRVARYLSMQFMVNIGYGILISVGLYFIGVPNAILWGAFATVMRFIPYIGPWIGAAIPVLLSLAVSKSWLTPIYTLSLFGVLELINANALEPWLYGSSTGVSSLALIVAAIFWTWLWGPVGLLLATPLTVCVTVMGRHVPRLHFLSVLLSEEEALSPAEECYHRLLALGLNQANDLAETFLKGNSLTALYDTVLLPVISAAEVDVQRRALETEERANIYDNLTDIIEDLGARPASVSKLEADKSVAEATPPPASAPTCRVLCLPARAQRDELAGLMLTQLLRQQDFEAENLPATLTQNELVDMAVQSEGDTLCISVVPPSTLIHARYLTAKLHARLPDAKIVVGFWGATENMADAAQRLRLSGADEVVLSLADAVVQMSKFSLEIKDEMAAAPIPQNEEERIKQLTALKLIGTPNERIFDRMTARLSRLFQVPIAFITFIDREKQWFKSQVGLPADIAQAGATSRALSVCGHMVANNELLVVPDIARDRRFANNPLLKERGLRFYAGVPIRVNNLPVGSICLLDVRPRRFSEENKRLLQLMADEVMDELNQRLSAAPAPPMEESEELIA